MRRRDQRLFVIGAAGAVLALAVTLTLIGFKDSVVFFFAPSEIAEKAHPGQRVRVGGLMVRGSLHRDATGATFALTDNAAQIAVHYPGLLPQLAVEGQGVVVEGVWRPGAMFEASEVLAKHDERYMPREVEEALKRRGEWRGPQ